MGPKKNEEPGKDKPFEEAKFKGNVDRSYRVEHGLKKAGGGLGGLVFDRNLISSYLPDADKLGSDKEFPFIIYPMDEGVSPPPPFFWKPSPSIAMSFYGLHACEGHAYDLLSIFISQGRNLTPRGKHAAALFLMTAIHLARNMELDIHRTAIWLSVAWQCFQLVTKYRTRDHIHLDRYFEETLLRHCVHSSPLGCEVFSEDEARVLQRFFCRFTRLLPLLQLYLFKVFDLELNLTEKRPYLRGKNCLSDMNLNFIDTMDDPLLRMDMYNRPKRDKETRKCSSVRWTSSEKFGEKMKRRSSLRRVTCMPCYK
uniref:UDP-N-acetylmuramoylalanine--D-glutamate ligase n=1 Tax=Lygus hesperus TaxID=30085 RepID=A0A0A9WTB9_LYGHE